MLSEKEIHAQFMAAVIAGVTSNLKMMENTQLVADRKGATAQVELAELAEITATAALDEWRKKWDGV